MVVSFVDIGDIVDHHKISFRNMKKKEKKNEGKPKKKQKTKGEIKMHMWACVLVFF